MNVSRVILAQVFFCFAWQLHCGKSFITTINQKKGRFCHQLAIYTKAKALSYLSGVPYLHRPFIHSSYLVLSDVEQLLPKKKFDRVIRVRKLEEIISAEQKGHRGTILYEVDLYAHINPFLLPSDFRDQMRLLISPYDAPKPIAIPKDSAASIAVHVRRGDCCPPRSHSGIKCHKNEEYVKLLRQLLDKLEDATVYVHIFTDDPDPCKIVDDFKRILQKRSLSFGYSVLPVDMTMPTHRLVQACFGFASQGNNQNPLSILTDFFNMASFDYLIRPYGSTFSIFAQFVGRHKLVLAVGEDDARMGQYLTDTFRRALILL